MRDADPAMPMPHPLPALRWRSMRFGLIALAGLGVMQACRLSGLPGDWRDWFIASLIYGAAMSAFAMMLRRGYPHLRLGACNTITTMRAALALTLIAPLLAGAPMGKAVAGLAALGLVLDGLDGWMARRSGLASEFGARFDMEVDALLALILSLHLLAGGRIGPEILILGLPRYLFSGLGWLMPWMAGPLPPSLRRKLICVLQMLVLIVLQTDAIPPGPALASVGIASALLLWSFAIDTLWLWRHRP